MISPKLLRKNVSSTRTYKYRIYDDLSQSFSYIQKVRILYFNYALKYLYQHYGSKHLNHSIPSGLGKRTLATKLVNFARIQAKKHNLDLKEMDYNVQSIGKMLIELIVAFQMYQRLQYGIKYWSEKHKKKYLSDHNCGLSGYGRINYKHENAEIRSATFQQDIKLLGNYTIKIPYFGKLHTKRSMTKLKHKKIVEVRIIRRSNGDFVLQAVTKFKDKKNLSLDKRDNLVGLDINLANNDFFQLSKEMKFSEKTWPREVSKKYFALDDKSRRLQHYLNSKNHYNNSSRTTKKVKRQLQRIKAKNANILDTWELKKAKEFSDKYPILAMEQLNSFTMRVSKRNKNYWLRKNTNHKLATFQPTTFRRMMEYIYQNDGHLLLEVDSYDTSKACHNCGAINSKLKIGQKKWTCPSCGQVLDRDYNASLNIRDWAQDITRHPRHGKKVNGRKVKDSDLLLAF